MVAIDNKIEQAMVSRYPRTVLRDPPHPGWVLCPERAPRSPAGSRAHGAFVCPSRLAEPVGAGSAAVRGELPGEAREGPLEGTKLDPRGDRDCSLPGTQGAGCAGGCLRRQ